ncbi:MAG: hypothetical protein IH853_11925 [Bacteroidetes bacterium]|nr:hypothetical protein [Bacteroidota bacterium]
MNPPSIDEHAKFDVVKKYALPRSLHVPIAARDEVSIRSYVGRIMEVLVTGNPNKAFLLEPYEPESINWNLPIWELKNSSILHDSRQLWVHVNYSGYRKAYLKAFPDDDMTGQVLDHVMNRRIARLKGFTYVRLVPISRAANSSSGGLSEKWGVTYHGTPHMRELNRENPAQIQYADLPDIVKMLDIKTGGNIQDPVNEARKLIVEDCSSDLS